MESHSWMFAPGLSIAMKVFKVMLTIAVYAWFVLDMVHSQDINTTSLMRYYTALTRDFMHQFAVH